MTEFKGTHITNITATPPTVVDGKLVAGLVKNAQDTWEFTNNENGDYVVVLPVPIDGVPASLKYATDDLTSGTIDIGLYSADGDGTFTAVDIDCFASSVAQGSGAVALTEILFEAAATNIANANNTFWEWAGLSARPSYSTLFITVTCTVGTGAAGTGFLSCDYKV